MTQARPDVDTDVAPPTRTLDFDGLRIDWDERLLEPRPWTALQSRWAAEVLAEDPELRSTSVPVLELCSGAGHIGLLAAALSGRDLVCVDVDPAAVRRTTGNAEANGIGDRVSVRCGRLQEVLREGEQFALVLADPPWVRHDDVAGYPEDPVLAIDGGDDGLALARDCVLASTGHLAPGGTLLLQVGSREQTAVLAGWAVAHGWTPAGSRTGDGGVVLRLLHP